tara:strand:+ start:566 stop:763 length:198 start_codon:yes stop_codon:yes gene_type:complete
MYLRIGDNVRHIFDSRISGRIVEIKEEKSQTMSTGGSFMNRKFALIEVASGQQHWVLFDDVMKND